MATVTIDAKTRVKKTIGFRRNLIKNPSFELGTDGWALDADFERSSDDAYYGQYAIKHVSTGGFANFTTVNDANGIDVLPNTDYVLSFYYKMNIDSGLGSQLRVCETSPFGTALAFLQMVDSGSGALADIPLARVTLTFNSGDNTKVWLRINNNGGTLQAFYDNFQLELGTQATQYFDGSLPSAHWEGSEHDSESNIPTIYFEMQARVAKTETKTIQAKARIGTLFTTKTVQAKARVNKPATRTISALAYVINEGSFNAESQKRIRQIDKKVEVDWQLNDTFYDETGHLLSMQVERRISEPLGGISLGMADIQWVNHDDRYTPQD